mmetsp:Transcript_6562/g.16171  ORF Transcript_6562/g.16171 Transcript_6562/m.16171 type:complete len:365 (-) Transcript_6562:384-1478(-)
MSEADRRSDPGDGSSGWVFVISGFRDLTRLRVPGEGFFEDEFVSLKRLAVADTPGDTPGGSEADNDFLDRGARFLPEASNFGLWFETIGRLLPCLDVRDLEGVGLFVDDRFFFLDLLEDGVAAEGGGGGTSDVAAGRSAVLEFFRLGLGFFLDDSDSAIDIPGDGGVASLSLEDLLLFFLPLTEDFDAEDLVDFVRLGDLKLLEGSGGTSSPSSRSSSSKSPLSPSSDLVVALLSSFSSSAIDLLERFFFLPFPLLVDALLLTVMSMVAASLWSFRGPSPVIEPNPPFIDPSISVSSVSMLAGAEARGVLCRRPLRFFFVPMSVSSLNSTGSSSLCPLMSRLLSDLERSSSCDVALRPFFFFLL